MFADQTAETLTCTLKFFMRAYIKYFHIKRIAPAHEQILVIRTRKHLQKKNVRYKLANNLGNNLLVSVSQ